MVIARKIDGTFGELALFSLSEAISRPRSKASTVPSVWGGAHERPGGKRPTGHLTSTVCTVERSGYLYALRSTLAPSLRTTCAGVSVALVVSVTWMGCGAFYDLDRLTSRDAVGGPDASLGPPGGGDGGGIARPADATTMPLADGMTERDAGDAEVARDAARDAPLDAVPEASTGGPCPAGRGPHMVQVDDFCIDSTEVTNDDYRIFLESVGDAGISAPPCLPSHPLVPTFFWPAPTGKERYPVISVDWCDARAYCAWAGKALCGARSGGGPFEAGAPSQYAWACSHGGTQSYPYGNNAGDGTQCNSAPSSGPWAVGSGAACEGGYAGLFDLVGNATEWVDACHGEPPDGHCAVAGGGYEGVSTCDSLSFRPLGNPSSSTGFRCCSH